VDDEPDVIRSQMDQTRADLTDKLETLEQRVSEGMESTGAVVNSTMTSVSSAVQSVSETLDFPLQVRRHPWIALTGAVALGFLAARLTDRPRQTPVSAHIPAGDPSPPEPRARRGARQGTLLGSLLGAMQELTARGLPLALDYLLSPRREPEAPQPMSPPVPATLPIPTNPSPAAGTPLNRRFV
jgi:ElaB/YqjD/DUF883 family membrane-anchored ribosome-binding protein